MGSISPFGGFGGSPFPPVGLPPGLGASPLAGPQQQQQAGSGFDLGSILQTVMTFKIIGPLLGGLTGGLTGGAASDPLALGADSSSSSGDINSLVAQLIDAIKAAAADSKDSTDDTKADDSTTDTATDDKAADDNSADAGNAGGADDSGYE